MAEPKRKALCGHCGSMVQAKCGSKVVWHWAHLAAESCDSWYEPETQWHRDWKNQFGIACSEISIVKEGVRHIADVLTKDNLVIEFQNSPISSETIVERELFYDKMIWVLNGAGFKENFQVWDREYAENWDLAMEVVQDVHLSPAREKAKVLMIHGKQIRQPAIREVLLKQKFIHDPRTDIYSYDLKEQTNSFATEARVRAGILYLYRKSRTEEKMKPVLFNWQRTRKSWMDAKKPMFIDLGEDHLIWIKTNMGTRQGEGVKVPKKDFLAKYAGTNY